jgi:hypothetical protein
VLLEMPGAVFVVHFFPRKNFPPNFYGKLFFQTFFRGKIQFSSAFLRGKNTAEFAAEKMYKKSAPGHCSFLQLSSLSYFNEMLQ